MTIPSPSRPPARPGAPVIEIRVPGDVVVRLGPNTRLHYYERHRRQQALRQAAWIAWRQCGSPRATGKYA